MNTTEETLTKLRKENAALQSALAKRVEELEGLKLRLDAIESAHLAADLGHSPVLTA